MKLFCYTCGKLLIVAEPKSMIRKGTVLYCESCSGTKQKQESSGYDYTVDNLMKMFNMKKNS